MEIISFIEVMAIGFGISLLVCLAGLVMQWVYDITEKKGNKDGK